LLRICDGNKPDYYFYSKRRFPARRTESAVKIIYPERILGFVRAYM
jgi:hypothetical protein